MGYRNTTLLNVILGESCEPSLNICNQYLCRNFLTRAVTSNSHPIWQLLETTWEDTQVPTRINRVGSIPLMVSFQSMERIAPLLPSSESPIYYSYGFEALLLRPQVNTEDGTQLQIAKDPAKEFSKIFREELQSSMCFFTDGSKMEGAPFSGFALVSLDGTQTFQFRTSGFLSSFCIETMAILATLELTLKRGWPAVSIFTDSKSALTAIEAQFNPTSSSYLILHIKSLLFQLTKKNIVVKLIWIPSH